MRYNAGMGVYEVSVQCQFIASHAVRLPDGSLEESHEHPWRATATFRSERLDPVMGVVIDFLTVQEAMRAVAAELEGRDLNSMAQFGPGGASAERVAAFLAEALARRLGGGCRLYRLALSEAPGCTAAYYPGGP